MTEAETASLAEEIRLLVEMVVERAAPWLEGVVSAGHGSSSAEDGGEPGRGWCPLCAIVEVVRGERKGVWGLAASFGAGAGAAQNSEFAARLIEQATQIIALLRAVLADRWDPEAGLHMPGFQPAPKPSPESSPERVQHIPVQWRES